MHNAFGPQHHNAVAKALREVRSKNLVRKRNKQVDAAVEQVLDEVTVALAAMFKEDNERFDAELFLRRATRAVVTADAPMGVPT